MKRLCIMIVAMAMLLGGCSSDDPADNDNQSPNVATLHVGHVGHDHQIALYVAALRGEAFIADYGIGLKSIKDGEVYDLVEGDKTHARLRLLRVGGGSKMPAAMSRGEIDIGFGGVPAVAKLAETGKSRGVKIICPLQTDGDMLVVRNGLVIADWPAFVAAAKAADRPLVIGYKAPLAVAKLIFERALKAEGVSYGYAEAPGVKVVLHNMKGAANAIPLLSSETIDGFVMNQPTVSMVVAKKLATVVAELRDLPPAGKWFEHPCCCICATGETLDNHREAVKALLKVIHLSTAEILADRAKAARFAAKWTKKPLAVEQDSVPTITYGSMASERWLAGMETWATMMQDVGAFTGRYKDIAPKDMVADVCDLSLCTQAADELKAKGLLK